MIPKNIRFAVFWAMAIILYCQLGWGQSPYQPYQNPKIQLFDNSGAIASGFRLCSFAAGTTTPQVTYADSSGTPNANPVVLDGSGRATVYLGASAYKFILYDASGNSSCPNSGAQIWSQDNISDVGQLLSPVITNPGSGVSQTITQQSGTNFIVSGGTKLQTLNSIYMADQYANLAAVSAVIGSGGGTTFIPHDYAGTDCPPNTYLNQTWFDFRGISQSSGCGSNVLMFNVNDGNVNSLMRAYGLYTSIPAVGGIVSFWGQTVLQNATGGTTLDGIEGEATLGGTFSGTLNNATGVEAAANIESTGGTVSIAQGIYAYANQKGTSTTNITTAIGVHGAGCNTCIGPNPVNVYSGLFEDVSGQGSSRNYSVGMRGRGLLEYSTISHTAGWDMEDNTNTPTAVFYSDNLNKLYLKDIGNGLYFYNKAGTLGGYFDASSNFNVSTTLAVGSGLPVTSSGVTCSMAAGTTCTATVPSGSVNCLAQAQGATPYYSSCSITGTTATVTASGANSARWLILATQ